MATSPSELRRLFTFAQSEGFATRFHSEHLIDSIVTRLDALTDPRRTDHQLAQQDHDRIVDLEAERDEARAKLAEAVKERDDALETVVVEREHVRQCAANIGKLTARLTAAESALAVARERTDDARRVALEEASRIWNAIAGDRVRTGVTRIEDEIVAKSYREVAADLMDRSRRRATTGGENIQRGGGSSDSTAQSEPASNTTAPSGKSLAAAPSSSPAAPDLDLHIDAMCREVWNTETRDHDVRALARRALKAEDEAQRLREALVQARVWLSASVAPRNVHEMVRDVLAQPEAGR